MHVEIYSYRFAEEILKHSRYKKAWREIRQILSETPLFVYPGKSVNNKKLDVVQAVMNTYFDRRFNIDFGWEYHPLATKIEESGLRADFKKSFGDLTIQVEVQFGNMARWYSDIFKFQTAYSQGLIRLAISIVPCDELGKRIDSNIAQFERAKRELPSAELSITLPIILAGIRPDKKTPIVDLRLCKFSNVKEITGKKKGENRWRIINGYLSGTPLNQIGPSSDIGPVLSKTIEDNGD